MSRIYCRLRPKLIDYAWILMNNFFEVAICDLSKMINEQDEQTKFGRIMLFYLKEIEYAWSCKDLQRLIELKADGDELQFYIWDKIEI